MIYGLERYLNSLDQEVNAYIHYLYISKFIDLYSEPISPAEGGWLVSKKTAMYVSIEHILQHIVLN